MVLPTLLDGIISTLSGGTSKVKSAVSAVGNLIIGRPKESTLDRGTRISSLLGIGMENGGGPVIVGNTIDRKVSEGWPRSGRIVEGIMRSLRMFEGRPSWVGLPRARLGTEGGLAGPGMDELGLVEPGLADGRVPERSSMPLGLTDGMEYAGIVSKG